METIEHGISLAVAREKSVSIDMLLLLLPFQRA
jgi:hypothetical protein